MSEITKVHSNTPNCPACLASWDGGSILETFIEQREKGAKVWEGKSDEQLEQYVKDSYSPPYRWSRLIGIELAYDHPKHYDGISYWQCPDCKRTWNRFTGKEESIPEK